MPPHEPAAAPPDRLLESLREDRLWLAVELRPPLVALSGSEGMDAWIDTYHSVRKLTRQGTHIFMTDRAVGAEEEENLRHLAVNLGPDADKSRLSQFLTAKHSLDYCLRFSGRALEQGFRSLVVLGGDRHDSIPRCVGHAYQLRQQIRERFPALILGGWANPHRDPPRQVEYILDENFCADFYLTQVVSHYNLRPVEEFLEASRRRGVKIPGIFGIFYYRSANRRTLEALSRFISVPAEDLRRDFKGRLLDADTICARSIQALWDLGVRKFYISNLDTRTVSQHLSAIAGKLAALIKA
jgi:hypothetical protein